jgi:diguanylate cyclase (GGDEF)-like protein/PAS domain S-box-containing protein
MSDPISYEALLDHLKDGVCVVDAHGTITFWNTGAERITGFARAEAVGQPFRGGLLHHSDKTGEPLFPALAPIEVCLKEGGVLEYELYLRRKDGTLAPVFTRISPILNPRDEVIGALELFSDNSSKVQALERIEELEEMALVCPVTGVGNRRYCEVTLTNALEELNRFGWPFGLLFVDVDHFKAVNDKHGHAIGDQVLRMVAHAMKDSLRSFDFVGRWGGEEFAILLPNLTDEILLRIAERCRLNAEESSFHAAGEEIRVTVSIGATMGIAGEDLQALVARADRLMYESKAHGRNRVTTDA